MPLFMSKEKEREYGIYERKEKNVAGDADIYCSCSGYRCRITPAKACPVCRNVYQTVWNNFFEPALVHCCSYRIIFHHVRNHFHA